MIGRLQRVPLREIWPDEARNFTPWLEENLEVLSETIDRNLTNAKREQTTGNFWVDLVAEDDGGDRVIIENQLGKSDHDHLGKVITYLAAYEASAAVWIVAEPRQEHVSAVSWLNESASAAFYLVKVDAVRIGDSPAAPLFTLISGPSPEGQKVGAEKKELAELDRLRYAFWSGLLEKARGRTRLHSGNSPTKANWVGCNVGKKGITFQYLIRQQDAAVELYIDRGPGSEDESKRILDQWGEAKAEIEAKFGEALDWDRMEGSRATRVRAIVRGAGGLPDEERWDESQDAMIDAMIRLEAALRPYIDRLPY